MQRNIITGILLSVNPNMENILTQAASINTSVVSQTVNTTISAGSKAINTVIATLRIIASAWEESRAEYKKHAILGGGWE